MATKAHRCNIFCHYYKFHMKLMTNHPWRTSAVNTGILMGTRGVIAQFGMEGRSLATYDLPRTARFLAVGLLVAGPSLNLWYHSLDQVIPGTTGRAALKKVFMDQAVFLPVYLAGLLGIMSTLRREGVREVSHKLKRDFLPLLAASFELWPAVQVVSNYLVPLHHRVLLINCVSLFWNSYISWKAEDAERD